MVERKYTGNPPGEEWIEVALVQAEGGAWRVFTKAQEDAAWLGVKVCAIGKAPRKGNYWLSWSGNRFGQGGDLFKLLEHRPALHRAVQAELMQGGGAVDLL
jgi:hypothetical protein